MKKPLVLLVVLSVLISFISCDILGLGGSDSDSGSNNSSASGSVEYGSLLVRTKDFSKSIKPANVDLNISKYKITATYKGTAVQGAVTSFYDEFSGETYIKSNILTGSWDIVVDGYDSKGIKVATYKKTIGIVKNEISTASFEGESGYITNEGKGSFKVSVQLPSGIADSIHVKINGMDEYQISKIGTSGGFDVFENTKTNIASGSSYTVTISIYKGSDLLKNLVTDESLVIHENLTSVYEEKLDSIKYKITYKDKGGEDFSGTNNNNPSEYKYGTGVSIITEPTKENYEFKGWYTTSDCSGDAITSISPSNFGDVTLYAKWNGNKYTVTLEQTSATTKGTLSVQATFGEDMPAIIIPSRTDYTFAGYYDSTDNSGTRYYDKDGKSVNKWNKSSSATLHAQWEKNKQYQYSVKLNKNTTDTNAKDGEAFVVCGSEIVITTNTTRPLYCLEGYYTDNNCSQMIITSDGVLVDNVSGWTSNGKWEKVIEVGEMVELYAKWNTINYLCFTANEAGSSVNIISWDKTKPAVET